MRAWLAFMLFMTPIASAQSLLAGMAAADSGPRNAWVIFTDKGFVDASQRAAAIAALESTYNPRAIARRTARRTSPGLFDERDLPVSTAYVQAIQSTGAAVRRTSRWANAVSVRATRDQLRAIERLPFVRGVQPVRVGRGATAVDAESVDAFGSRGSYGYAAEQLSQIGVVPLHANGHTGQGVVIGVLDTGFWRVHPAFNDLMHPLQVVAEYDFVNDDADTGPQPGDHAEQHIHGTLILGTLGAYQPGVFLGAAYDASFILCKTEDITSETPVEEDNYVAGLEFIEANGGDVTTASLIYIDWYTQADLNGMTAITTIAVNTATDNGVHCCNAAGNSGHDDDPGTSHLGAPADANRVITCGAAQSDGAIAWFSSDGPSADGRIKPEVLARGVGTVTVAADGSSGYWSASGTSLSTPLVAGAVACLVGARPAWTVDELRDSLTFTASDYAASQHADPLFVRGYGLVNAAAAANCGCAADLTGDCAVNLTDLATLLANFGRIGGVVHADGDVDRDGDVDLTDLAMLLAAFGALCG